MTNVSLASLSTEVAVDGKTGLWNSKNKQGVKTGYRHSYVNTLGIKKCKISVLLLVITQALLFFYLACN